MLSNTVADASHMKHNTGPIITQNYKFTITGISSP